MVDMRICTLFLYNGVDVGLHTMLKDDRLADVGSKVRLSYMKSLLVCSSNFRGNSSPAGVKRLRSGCVAR